MDAQLRKNVVWNAAGSIIYLACEWLVTILVARFSNNYSDAGVLSQAISLSAAFQAIAMFGGRSFQVSDAKKKYSDQCYIVFRWITCASAFLTCFLFSVFSGFSPYQIGAISLYMVFRVAESIADVFFGFAQKQDRLDLVGKSQAIKGVVLLTCFCGGFFAAGSLNLGLLFWVVGICLVTLFYDYMRIKGFVGAGEAERKQVLRLAKETAPLCLYTFLNSAISTAPKYVLERMCSTEALGAYASVFSPVLLIPTVASFIYYPFVTRFTDLYYSCKQKDLYSLVRKTAAAITICFAFAFAGGCWLGEPVLIFILGQRIAPYTYLLPAIMICMFSTAFLGFFNMLLVVVRDFRGLLAGNFLGFVLCAGSVPVLIDKFGMNGTSYGLILGSCAACVVVLLSFIHKSIRSTAPEKAGCD